MKLQKDWPEMSAIFLLCIGFVIGITTINSEIMLFFMVFLCGLIFGRMWYRLRNSSKVPWIIIMSGFIIGFLISSLILGYFTPFNIIFIIIFFIIGIRLSYSVHKSRFIKSTEY